LKRERFRLAVDAANLVRDKRGMGRLARAVLRETLADPAIELTLLAERGSDVRALRAEFPQTRVRWPITAQISGTYDALWYPFNGMRFPSAAPSLVTIHDVFAFTEPHPERVARYREQAPIERAARVATRVLTDSFWSRREIVRALGVSRDRITVVHPSPDAFWFPKEGDVLPAPIANRKFALLVGGRERRKNAPMALDACARAFAGTRDKTLVIVGELAPDDRVFARTLGLSCGEIAASDALLRALYRKASAVLVPSLAEGFGMVAVEALACGAPVLAANAAALPEATDGAALLLDPRDVAAWARAIRELCDDDARADAMRASAVARFATSDRTRAARETLAILKNLAASRSW
jgi:glycosyltransferase involved in cell wall biosynthesis